MVYSQQWIILDLLPAESKLPGTSSSESRAKRASDGQWGSWPGQEIELMDQEIQMIQMIQVWLRPKSLNMYHFCADM
jgi:hypothetical protein